MRKKVLRIGEEGERKKGGWVKIKASNYKLCNGRPGFLDMLQLFQGFGVTYRL